MIRKYYLYLAGSLTIELDNKQFELGVIYDWNDFKFGEEIYQFENSMNPVYFCKIENNDVYLTLNKTNSKFNIKK